jgi:hypothetical protein
MWAAAGIIPTAVANRSAIAADNEAITILMALST